MGRDAGWLAVTSALGKRDEEDAPHIILVPEEPFNADRFLAQVEQIYRRIGYVVVVAAETIRDEQGQQLGAIKQAGTNGFNHPLVSGTAEYLGELMKTRPIFPAPFRKPGR